MSSIQVQIVQDMLQCVMRGLLLGWSVAGCYDVVDRRGLTSSEYRALVGVAARVVIFFVALYFVLCDVVVAVVVFETVVDVHIDNRGWCPLE